MKKNIKNQKKEPKSKGMSREEKEILESMKLVVDDLNGKKPKGVYLVWEAATGKEVKKARALVHVSQSEFARLLRVSPRTIQAWEQGLKPPSGPATSWIRLILNKPDVGRQALMAAH